MAILDPVERILDVQLTNKGRIELSKNNLNFVFFAFSDEGVDYSGSLNLSVETGVNLDDILHRNLSFEAHQQKADKNFTNNTDLKSFLFTIPEINMVIPQISTSFDDRTNISLVRRFFIDQLILTTKKRNRIKKPKAVIARLTTVKFSFNDRLRSYVKAQKIFDTIERRNTNRSIIGRNVAKNFIAIRGDRALNIKTGGVEDVDVVIEREEASRPVAVEQEVVSIKKEIEVVVGTGLAQIDLFLKTGEGRQFVRDGFLIEIFESGSDGKLTKLVKENVVNPLNDDEIEKGFEDFLELRTDV